MRTKKVFSRFEQVAHVWASQNQEKARCRNGFFEGKDIYSYGQHFLIARFVRPDVVLFTTRTYSQTTAGHISSARSAVNHLKVFEVPELFDSAAAHADNLKYLVSQIEADLSAVVRKRSSIAFCIGQIVEAIERANDYRKTFDVKPADVTYVRKLAALYRKRKALFSKEQLAEFARREEVAKSTKEKRDAIRAAKWARLSEEWKEQQKEYARKKAEERERLPHDAESWKQGATVYNQFFHELPVMLRIAGENIETSKGAEVPLIEARKFWHALQRRENVVGMRLGLYTVDSLDGSTLTVGCHKIPLREVLQMAKALKWDDGTTLAGAL